MGNGMGFAPSDIRKTILRGLYINFLSSRLQMHNHMLHFYYVLLHLITAAFGSGFPEMQILRVQSSHLVDRNHHARTSFLLMVII